MGGSRVLEFVGRVRTAELGEKKKRKGQGQSGLFGPNIGGRPWQRLC